MTHKIPAGEFKAKCLQLMDQVKETNRSIVITKRGVPIARLMPIEEKALDLFGCMKGSVTINEDIIAPIGEDWSADE